MVRCLATESRVVVSGGEGGLGNYRLRGLEFQFGKTEAPWRSMVVMGTQQRERTPCR